MRSEMALQRMHNKPLTQPYLSDLIYLTLSTPTHAQQATHPTLSIRPYLSDLIYPTLSTPTHAQQATHPHTPNTPLALTCYITHCLQPYPTLSTHSTACSLINLIHSAVAPPTTCRRLLILKPFTTSKNSNLLKLRSCCSSP